jgi:hypothetical protein
MTNEIRPTHITDNMRFTPRRGSKAIPEALGVVLVASLACSDGGGQICNIVYLDPLFTIASARNAITSAPIPIVRISAVHVDNVPVPVTYLSEVAVAHDVTVEGDQLFCAIDCGFAATPGTYRFSVSSAGYRDTVVTVAANYSRSDNSCPVRVSGGVHLNLTLSPS